MKNWPQSASACILSRNTWTFFVTIFISTLNSMQKYVSIYDETRNTEKWPGGYYVLFECCYLVPQFSQIKCILEFTNTSSQEVVQKKSLHNFSLNISDYTFPRFVLRSNIKVAHFILPMKQPVFITVKSQQLDIWKIVNSLLNHSFKLPQLLLYLKHYHFCYF